MLFFLRNNPRRYSRHLSRQTSAQSHEGRKEKEDMELSTTDCGNQDKICGCIPAGRDAAKAFKEMMDFSLLKDGIFIMFAISNFLTSIGFNVPYVYTAVRFCTYIVFSHDVLQYFKYSNINSLIKSINHFSIALTGSSRKVWV